MEIIDSNETNENVAAKWLEGEVGAPEQYCPEFSCEEFEQYVSLFIEVFPKSSAYCDNRMLCKFFMQNKGASWFLSLSKEMVYTVIEMLLVRGPEGSEELRNAGKHLKAIKDFLDGKRVNDLAPNEGLKNIFVRVISFLLRFFDYLQTDGGKSAWANRENAFKATAYGQRIVAVVEERRANGRQPDNPHLLSSLNDSFACISFLRDEAQLRNPLKRTRKTKKAPPRSTLSSKVRFCLTVVSCLEGRGVFHDRSGKNPSLPYKCYRYMIDSLGGLKCPDDVKNEFEQNSAQGGDYPAFALDIRGGTALEGHPVVVNGPTGVVSSDHGQHRGDVNDMHC